METNVKEILKFSSDEFREYLKNKIDKLSKVDFFVPSTNDNKIKATNLFFGKDSKIVSGYAPLVLDDDEAYFVLFNKLKQNSTKYDLEKEVDKLVCESVQQAVFSYYGNNSPNDVIRTMMYKNAFIKDEDLSISNFKGTSMSMCTERSALAHNFFKILGYNSCYISGIIFLNGQRSLHSYNAVELKSGYKIYDLVCTPINSLEHNLPNPIMYDLGENEAGKLLSTTAEIDNLNLPSIEFKSQTGKIYSICYGNLDEFSTILCQI